MAGSAKPVMTPPLARASLRELAPEWLPLALGFLAMYVPAFWGLLHGIWGSEEQAHGPIILILSLWLIWRSWNEMLALPAQPAPGLAWPLLVFALVLYMLGMSQQVDAFTIASFIISVAAILLMKRGTPALRLLWFPFFFMLFMIPLPGAIVSALTLPMKMAVSYVTEVLLYAAGYPIARTGVILQIGPYQLLVADACAGLQTLLTLESLGLFYLNVVRHTSAFRNIALALLIIPISFTANVIRVCVLTLITYHFGDAAGQGFLHGFAGMVLFVSALILIIAVDSLLQWAARRHQQSKARSAI